MKNVSWISNKHVHFALLSVVGFLFFYKYGSRVSELTTLLYLPFIAILYFFTFRLKSGIGSRSLSQLMLIFANVALIAGSALAFQYVNVDVLDVDRWSVITHYWDAFFKGDNPYSSTSHMGNYYGSYPFYFILALPFYLLGEIGWAAVAALGLFQFADYKINGNIKETLLLFILCMASLCLPYEIVTRSTIFANSVLILLATFYFIKAWESEQIWRLIAMSAIVGLLVCTRPIYGLVFAIAGIYLVRKQLDIKKIAVGGVVSLLGLILPFAHLYVLYPESIFEYNPVAFMTTHFVPTWFYGIYLVAAIGLGFVVKTKTDIIPAGGLFLFFVVFCYALRYIIEMGWRDALFTHAIDISYFFMPLPFLIYTICRGHYSFAK